MTTALKLRGGEPRDADTATLPRYDLPAARVHQHIDPDTRGPFWVVVCTCGSPESPAYTWPETAERAKANHDMAHADELAVASS